jgi:DNA-binding IclR family transcriptional regulator
MCMQVTLDGVTVDFHVSPVLASILSHFEEQEEFSAAELAERVGENTTLCTTCTLQFVAHGILHQGKGGG